MSSFSKTAEGTLLMIGAAVNRRDGLMQTLRHAGFTLLATQTGKAGYQRAGLTHLDLILLSLRLPDMDGFELCQRLKANAETQDIPVILLADVSNQDEWDAGFQVGAVDYLSEPLREGEVLARIRTHVQLRRLILEKERRRLSRELHDSVTQSLYSLLLLTSSWEMMAAAGRFEVAQAAAIFGQLHQVAQQAYQEMRLLIHQLRPLLLEKEGLVAALQQRLACVEQRAGLETVLLISDKLAPIAPNVSEQLFFIAQEALNNALRHARATMVTVRISQEADCLQFAVADNGRGFDPLRSSAGLGLTTMRERADLVGGRLTITSVPQQGTTVLVTIQPMHQEENDE